MGRYQSNEFNIERTLPSNHLSFDANSLYRWSDFNGSQLHEPLSNKKTTNFSGLFTVISIVITGACAFAGREKTPG